METRSYLIVKPGQMPVYFNCHITDKELKDFFKDGFEIYRRLETEEVP